jgi:hypothetical protein
MIWKKNNNNPPLGRGISLVLKVSKRKPKPSTKQKAHPKDFGKPQQDAISTNHITKHRPSYQNFRKMLIKITKDIKSSYQEKLV